MNLHVLIRIAFATISLAAVFPVDAQQAGRIYKIAWLRSGQDVSVELENALLGRLASQGYVEGKNLSISKKGTLGSREEHAAMARDLVAAKPDVLLTGGTTNTRILQSLTSTIPIVFLGAADPVAAGFVKSLAHPGGNITGISNQQCAILSKVMELAREVVPKAKRIAVVASGTPQRNACAADVAALRAEGASIEVLWSDTFQAQTTVGSTVEALARLRPDMVVAFGTGANMDAVIQSLNEARRRVPIVSTGRAGSAVTLNFDFEDTMGLAADMIAKLFTGTAPGDLPVAQPRRYRMDVDLPTAKAQGVRIPESVLLRASHVTE
jgi:putative ABC transport system substrate-binding protein